jgi:hydrogenase maturation protein HypF
VAYEAEAAMRFEGLAREAIADCDHVYSFDVLGGDGPLEADPRPVIAAVAADVLGGVDLRVIAARFHLSVADVVGRLAETLRARTGLGTVALSGGVFLNVVLTRLCLDELQRRGLRVLHHRIVPPSDAGLALGQLVVAARCPSTERRSSPCA